jgi:ABC-2 type transport system permease protein
VTGWQGAGRALGRQLTAEVLKVLTTRLWWALLIPVAAIAALIGFIGAAVAGLPDVLDSAGTFAPATALTVPISMKQTSVFAVVLGLVGGAGEFRHKTISTTYLTAASRGTVLAAKAVVHAGLGLLYGLTTFACCTLGAVINSGDQSFPPVADTVSIAAAGGAGVAGWCVLGVGLGMLIGNQVAALVTVLVYVLVAEGLIGLVLRIPRLGLAELAHYLPGAGATALQTGHGIATFARSFGEEELIVGQAVQSLVGQSGQLSYTAGGLLFAGYTMLSVAAGWLAGRRRDIS